MSKQAIAVTQTTIHTSAVAAILDARTGKMLTVDAIKKNGDTTRQNGQLAPSPPSHSGSPHLRTIIRSRSQQPRSIDIRRVTRIAFEGQVFSVAE